MKNERHRSSGFAGGPAFLLLFGFLICHFAFFIFHFSFAPRPPVHAALSGFVFPNGLLLGSIVLAGDVASQPAATGPVERARLKQLAWQVVMIASVVLLLVMAALAIWVLQWGRRLKQRDSAGPFHGQAAEPDPWKAAAERMDVPPAEDEEQGPP